jgi:hypothetical protein
MKGHEYKDHGDGIHLPQALVFKDLKAAWSMRSGSTRTWQMRNSRIYDWGGIRTDPFCTSLADEDYVSMFEDENDLSRKHGASDQVTG